MNLGAVSLALLTAFVFIERSHPAPLIRLGIFRVRSLAGANGVMLLAAGGLFAFFFFSTLYVQLILGYSPLEAGLAFLPVAVGIGVPLLFSPVWHALSRSVAVSRIASGRRTVSWLCRRTLITHPPRVTSHVPSRATMPYFTVASL